MENKDSLQELKTKYEAKKIVYNLPDYSKFGEDFDVEKASEKETDFIIREVRRIVIEKISAYMHLFETILNPSSGSLLIFSVIKNLDHDDKKDIRELYKKLAAMEITSMKLDTIYNEKTEADFILKTYCDWQDIKIKINKIFEKFDKELDINGSSGSSCYLG